MIFKHSFRVQAPLEQVQDFHRRSASMGAITPPPVIVQMHSAPPLLDEGDEMTFTLWLGPLPLRWRARIEDTSPTGFVDRQISGPFAEWVHRHSFVEVESGVVEVRDEVFVCLHETNLLWKTIGFNMWLTLPLLFRYRQWKTQRILQTRPAGEHI